MTAQVPLLRSRAARSPGPFLAEASASWRPTHHRRSRAAVDDAEHAERRRRVVVVRQPGQRERQARVVAVGVVHEDRVLADVGDLDDAQLTVGAHDDTLVAVGAEADRLTVLEVDHHLLADLAAGDVVERAVVEHVAVLEDLDERRALVGVRLAEDLHHVLAVEVVGAGDERLASAPSATLSGLNGGSIEPNGVLLVTLPISDVGEYWPLVRP